MKGNIVSIPHFVSQSFIMAFLPFIFSSRSTPPKSIVITGASSGIGRALAEYYAQSGVVLGLVGRHHARLQEVAEICRASGADVELGVCDVTHASTFATWLKSFDEAHPVDMLIANAGIAANLNQVPETAEQTEVIFNTNLQGVLNTVLPLWPNLIKRKHGQVVLMSSIAGFRGLQNAPAYSASKVAVRALGEAWRGHLKPFGIRVNVVCPGFVHSGITAQNHFPMPGIMPAEKAASIIARGLAKNKAIITFPWWLAWPAWLMACLPVDWVDALLCRLPRK